MSSLSNGSSFSFKAISTRKTRADPEVHRRERLCSEVIVNCCAWSQLNQIARRRCAAVGVGRSDQSLYAHRLGGNN